MAKKSSLRIWAEGLDHIPTPDEVRAKFPHAPNTKVHNMLHWLKKSFPTKSVVAAEPERTVMNVGGPVELALRIGEAGANIKLLNGTGHLIGVLKTTPTGAKFIRPNAKSVPEKELGYNFLSAMHEAQLG